MKYSLPKISNNFGSLASLLICPFSCKILRYILTGD